MPNLFTTLAAALDRARRLRDGTTAPPDEPPATDFPATVLAEPDPDTTPRMRRDGVWLGHPFLDGNGEARQNRMPVSVLWRDREWSVVQRVITERPFVIPTADLLLT